MKTPEEKKKAQAIAHKKWYMSEKGAAYRQRLKEKKSQINDPAGSGTK